MDKIVSIYKGDEPTSLRLKSFRAKSDGSTDVDIEYDEVFLETLKKFINKEVPTQEDLTNYVDLLIQKATMGKDGYRMEVDKEELV